MLESLSLGALAFAPGLAIGSFLNVIASRVPIHKPIGASRSVCMSCDAQIRGYDNIPVLSYLLLRGRCRDCKASIPMRYLLVELGTALLVAASFANFGLTWEALLAAAFCVVLVALTAIDIEHRIVPNRIVLPAAVVMLVAHTLVDPSPEWALGALGAFAALFVVALIQPGGMGMGDVKLCLFLGAMLGWNVFVGLFVGIIAGAAPAIVLAVRHGKAARKLTIPFAPFLAFGGVVALFFGDRLVDWWLGLTG
jgi:leader peptidase (prepilin peptidase) / N-methyltransferase